MIFEHTITPLKLRYQFPGVELLDHVHSQIGQELFVLSCLKGLRNGRYVEIGAWHPWEISNTHNLEKKFGWSGISFDIVQSRIDFFNNHRHNKAVFQDAITASYATYFDSLSWNDSRVIHYASVDCEPPLNTFKALQRLIDSGYQFATITFEHDTYSCTTPPVKEMSRELLISKGYNLIAGGVMAGPNGYDQEDWWVHPQLVDMNHVNKFKSNSANVYWYNYIYPNNL